MLVGAVSAMYTGTVTDAPPVFEHQAKQLERSYHYIYKDGAYYSL